MERRVWACPAFNRRLASSELFGILRLFLDALARTPRSPWRRKGRKACEVYQGAVWVGFVEIVIFARVALAMPAEAAETVAAQVVHY